MIHLTAFKGEAPAINSRNLPPENAEKATNLEIKYGTLRALRGMDSVLATLQANTKSIYLYENQFWFSWNEDVSVLKSPVAQDVYRRVYFTRNDSDGVAPQVTSNLISTGVGVLPGASYKLGVPSPQPPSITGNTPPAGHDVEDFSDDETRFYVMTLVTEYGEEGPPSVVSNSTVAVAPGSTITLSLPIHSPNVENINRKRIYRTSGTTAEFFFVGEVALSASTFVDTVDSDQLGDVISTINYFPPPEGLRNITMMANGITAGFVGNKIYFSPPYLPYAYPPEYSVSTEYDIVSIQAIQTSLIAVTEGNPYIFSGVSPDALSEERLSINQSCVSSRSIVNIGNAVIYASPDGLMAITTGSARLATQTTMTKELWQGFQPETIHAYYYENQYIAFYGDDNSGGGFIYDLESNTIIHLDFYASAGYADLQTDTLYLVVGNQLFSWDTNDQPLNYVWRSKRFETGRTVFNFIRVRGNSKTIKVNVWADGDVILNQHIVSDEIFRLPPRQAKVWQVELLGSEEITSVTLAKTMDELRQV